MNTAVSNLKADYLDRVHSGLADLSEEDREEVMQDLRAHLAELDEESIEANLGTPEEFVEEFRASAGLEEQAGRVSRLFPIARMRTRLEQAGRRLALRSEGRGLRL